MLICYDANGGSWENGNTYEYHYQGAGEYYYVGMEAPQSSSREFIGWSAEPNGEIVDGDEYILSADETYIFYAQWVDVRTIVYDANGGQFDNYDDWNYETSEMHIRTARIGEEYYLDGAEPHKDRCQFIGWSLDGVTPVANPMTIESDVRLYALWRESYNVTYIAQLGCWADWWDEHGYPQNPKSTIMDTEIDGEYYINGWWPEAGEAYRFVGYATSPNSSEAVYTPGQYIGMLDADMTLYAVWQKRPKITFDANGGHWGEGEDIEITRSEYNEVGRKYYVRYEQPWRDNYDFVGWEDEYGNLVDNDMLTLAEGDEYVFYARWAKKVVITYYANGGAWDRNDDPEYEYHEGRVGEYYYIGTGNPRRDGYDFDGWVDENDNLVDGEEILLEDGVEYTFYARWIMRVSVAYDANGGIWDEYDAQNGETSSIRYHDERVGEYYTDGWAPRRDGYWFVGWSLDGKTPVDNPIMLDSDTTLFAIWKPMIDIIYRTSIGGWRDWDENGQEVLLSSIVRSNVDDETRVDGWRPECDGPYRFLGYATEYGSNVVVYYPDDILEIGDTESANSLVVYDPYYYLPIGQINLYAVWEKLPTVTYHAEGGAWGWDETTRVEWQEIGRKYYVRNEWPQLDGYEFAGWIDADGEPADNRLLTMAEGDEYHFYATWKQRLTVTYDANGGHWGMDPYYHYTEDFDATAGDYRVGNWYPEREGYICRGWSTDPNATKGQSEFDIDLTENVTIYAVWEKVATLTLYAGEGAYFNEMEGANHTEYYRIGQVVNTDRFPTPHREGYSFVGWKLDGESVSRRYRMLDDVTFTAEWVQDCWITLDVNADDGCFDNGYASYNVYFADGDFLVLRDCLSEPVRAGYIFDGWYLDAECTDSVDTWFCVASESVTFYAGWVEGDPITVTWDAKGGYIWGDPDYPTYTETFPVNSYINMDYYPSREGYLFAGWYLDEDYNESVNPWDYLADADVTFYAKWSEGVTVTWNGNGGTIWPEGGSDAPTLTKRVLEGSNVGGYTIPTREGYVFVGWCFDEDCEEPVYDIWSYVVNGDVTFYAKWAEAVQITWNGNGGFIWDDTDYPTYTATYAKGQRISYGYSVYRDDYSFEGWYLDSNFSERVDFDEYVVTENVTFYAKWYKTVVVTWDANGGCVGDDGQTTITELAFQNEMPQAPSNHVARSGYIFNGWYLDSNSEEPIPEDYVFTKDVTFYAGWVEEETNNMPEVSSITSSESLQLLENVDGYYYSTEWDDGYFYYTYKHTESYGDVLNDYGYELTVNYTDGTSFTGTCDQINALGYGGVFFSDDQNYRHWYPGSENYLTVSYRGVQSSIPVTIVRNTVTSISCSDSIQIAENTNGYEYVYNGNSFYKYYTAEPVYVDYENGKYYDEFYNYDLTYTVTFANGETLVGNAQTLYERTGLCLTISGDEQWTEHWYLGGTYYITADFAGCSTSIPVSIVEYVESVEKEVASITCSEALQLLENVDGYYDSTTWEWDDGSVSYAEYFRYTYKHAESYGDVLNDYGFELTVNYTDGTSFTGTCDEINALGYGGVYFNDDQSYGHWYPDSENYLTVSYRGVESLIPVTVVRNTVADISCQNSVRIYEYTSGTEDTYNGDSFYRYYASQHVYLNNDNGKYYDEFYGQDLIYTVTFTDGSTLVGNAQTLYSQTRICLTITGDDQWTQHWDVGNTYYICANFAGCSTSIPVSIESLTLEDISVNVESINVPESMRKNPDSDSYVHGYSANSFRYCLDDLLDDLTYTVVYNGGQTISGSRADVESYFGCEICYATSQDVTPWEENNSYEVSLFMSQNENCACTLVANVLPHTIQSVSCIPLTDPRWDPDDDQEWDYLPDDAYPLCDLNAYLEWYDVRFTVTFTDGETFTGTRTEIYNRTGAWINACYDQDSDPIRLDQSYVFELEICGCVRGTMRVKIYH